ncbi:MAG: hypothetical protein ACJ8R9_33785 [Steroidobacteraceae bacterium]
MAKKKRGGKRDGSRQVQGVLRELQVVEKDVARVRENLRKFLLEAEEVMGGPIFKRFGPPKPPKLHRT